jgi:hypothetical protein
VAVQPKPVRSPGLIPGRGRRATGSVTAPVDRQPRRRGAGASFPRPTSPRPTRRFAASLSAAPTPAPDSPVRGRFAGGSVGGLMFVFVAATLVMVTAVIAVGIVDRWWVLVPVMLVDLATTFGVVAYIMRLLADVGEAPRSTPR